jgi:glutamate-ammonia-ligase adenylyltransferase
VTTVPPHPLPALTPELEALADRRWMEYLESCRSHGVDPTDPDPALEAERRVAWSASDFVAQSFIRQPALLADLTHGGDLARPRPDGAYPGLVTAALRGAADDAGLKAALRRLRTRELVRIAWRDLAGLADLTETVGELSGFADAVLAGTLDWLHARQAEDLGTPTRRDGEAQRMVVLALGKLGGQELNFSSDVDLIFAIPEEGTVVGGRRELASSEFFLRLGQRLITALSERTPEGFVFRVDMRLRPFGGSGPLVTTFDGMETYYQSHGRDWERYAFVKARVVAGDRTAGETLLARLRPFVYRRYLDYGAFESLREMKALVAQEVARKGLQTDLKLGPGGIREVEFIAQAFQLVRGGREPALRVRGLLPALAALTGRGHLPDEAVRELSDAYVFLRRAEHRVQAMEDRQTQALPADPLGQARLACTMGHADWAGFSVALDDHRRRVDTHFQRVFAAPPGEDAGGGADAWQAVWLGLGTAEAAGQTLADGGFAQAQEGLARLNALRTSRAVRLMSRRGRERLDRLVPLLLAAVGRAPHPDATLGRLVGLVETIAGRSVYLSLLYEHPRALAQLVALASASPWIAEHLRRHPILLDELLDSRSLYAPPDRPALERELGGQLARVGPEDVEQQMDTLRLFKQASVLRVAAADVSSAIPLMVVSDHLTELAEVILKAVCELAWRDLVARHGRPRYRERGETREASFGVIAYGKLGGIELGYGSDLDIVFLHTSSGQDLGTDGERPLANGVFFGRLAQRIIHYLTAHTASGSLYEIDFRLRPDGRKGLLVSSVDAFEEYQINEAWTWEHQALVRARPVVADPALARRFQDARRKALTRERDPEALRREVREMREKMRGHLGSRSAGRFDLKQDRGGIADIEFVVQYLTIRWGREHPDILRFTDNIRLLDGLAEHGRIAPADARFLADAYRSYRARVHTLALQGQQAVVGGDELRDLQSGVSEIWQRVMEA